MSGASSKAAKGRLSCRDVAVICKFRHVVMAALICSLFNGVRATAFVVMLEVETGTGVEAEGGAEEVEDAGVNGIFAFELGVAFLVTVL